VTADGQLTVTVDSAQYHGQEFYCSGRTADGTELYFMSEHRIAKGDIVRVAAAPNRILVYRGAK
jgi:putative spermidine/putrescine transport system ATP-binding protein